MEGLVVILVFGVIMALLAKRKGYNPFCWFFAAGILGLLILAFLPFTNKGGLSQEEITKKVSRGNSFGITLSLISVGVLALRLLGII